MGSEAWIEVEAKKARSGVYPDNTGADQQMYLAWIRDCDARKCQSMLLQNQKIDELLKIRALLFRGQLDEAESIIQKCTNPSAPPEEQMEVLLEQARLAAFRGDWNLCHALSAKALESNRLESLSYLSTLQVHALSCFELGEFHSAMKALDLAESLATVFPFSISAHYASVLRARLIARDQSVQNGRLKIAELWQKIRTSVGGGPTADSVHAIVFGMVDILKFSRVMGGPSDQLEKAVLVSFSMTEAMGEQLYSALASLDAAVCGPVEQRTWFLDRLAQARREFKRIDGLASEVFEGKELSSTSAATLAALQCAGGMLLKGSSQPNPMNYVILTEHKWAFQLQPWKAVDLSGHPQILAALKVLSNGALSKVEFFNRVWGNTRYTPRLHDSSIWYVLNRIKKLVGAVYKTRNGMIEANAGVISL